MPPTPRPRHVLPIALLTIGATTVGSSALALPDQAERQGPRHARSSQRSAPTAAPAQVHVVTAGAPVRTGRSYTVRQGDTLSEIAQRLGVSVSALRSANGIGADGFIRAGQRLTIPGGSSSSSSSASSSGSSSSSGGYTVRAGDTVSGIAGRFGVSTASIIAANGLSSDGFIREGQRLRITRGSSSGASTSSTATSTSSSSGGHRVRSGETFGSIANRYGVSVDAVIAANPGVNPRALQIGQTVRIPGGSSSMPNTFAGRTYPQATVAAASANQAALAAQSVPSRAQMQAMVAATARRYGVDPALAQAIAHQESGFNMRAVSPANAVGTMQVIPSSGQWASQLAGRPLNLRNPQDNVTAGVLILRANLRAAPDQATAIAAYYQGLSSVRKNGMYADTRRYVASVQTLTSRYR